MNSQLSLKMRLSLMTALSLWSAMRPVALRAEEIPTTFFPPRAMAMGGAFTAISNDENSAWTNPAGIARTKKARSRNKVGIFTFPNLVAGANGSSRAFYAGLKSNTEELGSALAENDSLADKPFWAMASVAPMMLFDMGDLPTNLGAFSNTVIKAQQDEDNTANANANIVSDMGGLLGVSFTDKSRRINFGLQVRSIGRYSYEGNLPLTTLADKTALQKILKDDSNKAAALAVDAGFMWTLADFWFPTLGVAVLNAPTGCKDDYLNPFTKTRQTVCGTVYSGKFSNEDALSTIDPMDLRVGLSISPRLSGKIGLRIAADMHQINIPSGDNHYGLDGIEVTKKAHIGAELFSGNPLKQSPFSASIGLSQGFYTMGVSARVGFLTLDFASFGADLSSDTKPKEDRRYVGGISTEF